MKSVILVGLLYIGGYCCRSMGMCAIDVGMFNNKERGPYKALLSSDCCLYHCGPGASSLTQLSIASNALRDH